ncbi:MAG: hypothetical protein JOZ46_09245, partial [Candidatus Dormibacteraeota bacterium]|nr:hypothetical protein [Candidatus Dormibacteraeota bacterium]
MRRSRLATCFVLLAALALAALTAPRHGAATPATAGHTAQKLEEEAPPGDEFLNQRLVNVGGALTDNAFALAGQQALSVRAQTASADPADATAQWSFDGPTNIDNPHGQGGANDGGGRVADLAVDPLHAGVVYAASAG